MNKHIRILSGRHRGASLQLAPGTWRIGCDDAAAVHISDWAHAAIDVTIDADGRIRLHDGGATVDVVEHETLHFDGIALCIGDPEAEPAAAPSAESAAVLPTRRRPPRRWLALGAVAVHAAQHRAARDAAGVPIGRARRHALRHSGAAGRDRTGRIARQPA